MDAATTRRPAMLRRLGILEVAWARVDRRPDLAWLAIGVLSLAGLLAVVGPPPVDLHGPLHRWFGIMDPACGMTRGVIAMLRARPGLAVAYNPASPLVVVAALAVLVRVGVGRLTGRWLDLRFRPTSMFWLLAAILLLLLWVNQQRHATLLLT